MLVMRALGEYLDVKFHLCIGGTSVQVLDFIFLSQLIYFHIGRSTQTSRRNSSHCWNTWAC